MWNSNFVIDSRDSEERKLSGISIFQNYQLSPITRTDGFGQNFSGEKILVNIITPKVFSGILGDGWERIFVPFFVFLRVFVISSDRASREHRKMFPADTADFYQIFLHIKQIICPSESQPYIK